MKIKEEQLKKIQEQQAAVTKILNEELSTQNQRQRSQEMLSNIKLVDEDIN